MIDKSLSSLPRRQTDGAIVIRSQDSDAGKARVFKLNASMQDPVLVERYAHRVAADMSVLTSYIDKVVMNGNTGSTALAAISALATSRLLRRSSQVLSYTS